MVASDEASGGGFVAVWWFLEARMMVKRGWVAVMVRTIRPRWIFFVFFLKEAKSMVDPGKASVSCIRE